MFIALHRGMNSPHLPPVPVKTAAVLVFSFQETCELVFESERVILPACHLIVLPSAPLELAGGNSSPVLLFAAEELNHLDLPRNQPVLLDEVSVTVLWDVFIEHHRPAAHQHAALVFACHQALNLESPVEAALNPPLTTLRQSLADQIDDYLKTHLDETITLNCLVQKFQYSATHLCRQMRLAGKPSPMQRLAELRLEKARELLQQKDLAISQVAAQVGMSDLAAFSHFFKHHCGQSPTEFRENIKWLI